MAKKSAALNIIFGADTKELDKALGDLGKRLRATADGLTSIGKTMSIGLTAPIGAFAAMSGKTFVDFEFQMQKVKAVSGATAAEFARLQKQAEDLGASTVFSASDVAMLQQEFAKLGFTAAEIDKVTEATLYLAQATDSDLARAAEVAGSTLRGFGLDASQTAMVTDVMAQSFNATSLDLDSFAEAMKYVAPVAAAAGLSIEETTAMLGALANSGIKGSQAGTSLRKIIGDLGKEGGSVTERIDQLAASGLNLAGAQDEVGRQAQTALLVLSKSKPQLDELTASFEDSGGAAKAMADIMNDSTMGSIKAMESAVEGMQIKIGAALAPAIIKVTEIISGMATAFTNMSATTQKVVVVVGLLVAAVGPLLLITGQLIGAYTTISGAIAAKAAAHAAEAAAAGTATGAQLRLNMAILANPYALAAAAIAGLILYMVDFNDEVRDSAQAVENLQEEIEGMNAAQASMSATAAIKKQTEALEELRRGYDIITEGGTKFTESGAAKQAAYDIAKAEETLAALQKVQKQKESDAWWSAQADRAIAEMNKKQEKQNVTMGETVKVQETVQSKLQQRIADIEAEFQVTSDLEVKINALKDAYLEAAIEARKLKDVNLSEELYQQFLATGRVEGGAMTPLAPIATPDAVPQVGGATPVPVLQDTTASTQRLNEALNALNAQDALARQAEEAAQFEALMQRLADTAMQLGQSFGAAFGQLITGAEGGKDAMKQFASQAIDAAFMAASGFAIQAATQSSLATGPAAAIVLPALITAGLAGLREVFRGITGLATGGLTTGPMLAMIGDNQSGKEAVIPFERMGEFLQMAGVGAQSNQNIVVQGRISGRDILISNQRTGRDANRYR